MAERKPIPVRLSDDEIRRLDKAAGKIGCDRSTLIRMLVHRWLDYHDAAGSKALPFDFAEVARTLDGRRRPKLKVAETKSRYPTKKSAKKAAKKAAKKRKSK